MSKQSDEVRKGILMAVLDILAIIIIGAYLIGKYTWA